MYIYIKCVLYIYVIVCIFLNGAASCDWWNIGTIWYRLLVCFPTMYCSGVATEWRRDSDQLPKRWHSSSMTRNCYHHHSVHGKPNGIFTHSDAILSSLLALSLRLSTMLATPVWAWRRLQYSLRCRRRGSGWTRAKDNVSIEFEIRFNYCQSLVSNLWQ